jgi:hypothetical protein
MIADHPIIIIQNTSYHFETVISLYQVLKNLGYNPYIYRYIADSFNQESFISKYKLNIATSDIINNALCGFVVSAYPNPQVTLDNCIPNNNNIIFDILKNKLIYICHRFDNKNDFLFNPIINASNSISLSPISNQIGIDYLFLTDNPLTPNHLDADGRCGITIQGHFELQGRDRSLFYRLFMKDYSKYQDKIYINIVGTNVSKFLDEYIPNYIYQYSNLSEIEFYDVLNNKTHWIMPSLDDQTNGQTYKYQRYSSNFNHALALEKPIICHKYFQSIYKLSGIYYDTNAYSTFILDQILEMHNNESYANIFKYTNLLKYNFSLHNKSIIDKKISYMQ